MIKKYKKYGKGGSLKMVEKNGKMVPFYAADGKGKAMHGSSLKLKKKKKEGKY